MTTIEVFTTVENLTSISDQSLLMLGFFLTNMPKSEKVVLNSLQIVRARAMVHNYLTSKTSVELASITSADLIRFINSSSDPALHGARITVDIFWRRIFNSDVLQAKYGIKKKSEKYNTESRLAIRSAFIETLASMDIRTMMKIKFPQLVQETNQRHPELDLNHRSKATLHDHFKIHELKVEAVKMIQSVHAGSLGSRDCSCMDENSPQNFQVI